MPLSALFDGYATPDAAERASILIVDDLPEKLLVFETILADLDQHLVIARSGSEALREVLRQQFAVILMDVNMPGIDGLETARLIRGYRRSAHTPIIFVTAYADELQTAQGYSLGAVDYILSPVIPDVLRSKVRVFVDLFIMQQRLRQQALERIAIARAEAAQRAAEENTRRSIFLAQAGRELADSLDAEVAMRRLLALLVPRFAPRALLWLRDAGHGHERVLRCDAPIAAGEPPLFIEGREQMLSEVLYNAARSALEQMIGAAGGGASPALLRRETASGVALPLVAGERALGGLLLVDPHRTTGLADAGGTGRPRRDRLRERAALRRAAGGDRRAPTGRGRAARGQPPQGRVPGDALPRAAQSARADPQRDRGHAGAVVDELVGVIDPGALLRAIDVRAQRRRAGTARRGARAPPGRGHRDHRPSGASPDPPGRRAAGRRPHQPGEDRAQDRDAGSARRRAPGRGAGAVADRRAWPAAAAAAARSARRGCAAMPRG